MSDLRKAAEMALLALEDIFGKEKVDVGAINALRQALAQPEQEPVAGEPLPCPFCGHRGLDFDEGSTYRWGVASCSGCGASCGEIRREYPDQGQWHTEAIAEWNRRTSPQPAQPSKPWVGLTDEDLAGCDDEELKEARYWERVLREKNA